MSTQEVSTTRLGLKYGLIVGAIATAIKALVFFFPNDFTNILQILTFVFLIVGMVLAINEYKKYNEGYISFKEGFSISFVVSAIAGLIAAFFAAVQVYAAPQKVQEALDEVREEYEAQGLNEDTIEMAMKWVKVMMTPESLFIITVVGSLFFGLILSAIVAAIKKNERF